MSMNPSVWIEEMAAGHKFTGVESNGTVAAPAVGSPTFRGRIRKYAAATQGGLIKSFDWIGLTVLRVYYRDDGGTTTNVKLKLVDPDGFWYPIHTETTAPTAFVFAPTNPVFVPPGWSLTVETDQNVAADKVARLAVMLGSGWRQDLFDQAPELGV